MADNPQEKPSPGAAGVQDLTGTTVGRFAVRVRLGAGGMGEVYRADDTKLKRSVALKRMAPHLHADERYRQRFLKEAERASRLTDQHIAGLYDVFEEGGETFLVMEYVEGETLRQRLARKLSLEQFLGLAVQCAEALVTAHGRGIVHRDLKPENIMLTPDGQVKVLDFGVAKRLPRPEESAETEGLSAASTGGLSGTPAYMAPETLLEQEADGRADIFSLGVVFYEALTGRHPFLAGSFVATSDRILREQPAPLRELNPRVPAELERIVSKMLAKHAEERYATAADLLVDLRTAQREVLSPSLLALRRPRPLRFRWVVVTGVAVALVLGSAIGIPALRRAVLDWLGFGPPEPRSLAVLRFENVGGDPANQAFCDGLTWTLTSQLAQLEQFHGSLLVVSASDVLNSGVRTAAEARKKFGANLVLTGSVQRAGEQVRLTASLVDAGTRQQLGSFTFDAQAADSAALQDGVAARVAELLELELQPQARATLARGGTAAPGAYELYLRGWGFLQDFDKPANLETAISLFRQALALDPDFALAHAGLGEAYWKKFDNSKDTQWLPPARQACERALALEPELAAGHNCLGACYSRAGEYEKAAAEFRRTLQSQPSNDEAYGGLAVAYERLGRATEAEQTYRQAIAVRQNYWAGHLRLGTFYIRQARYEDAAEEFLQAAAVAPENVQAHRNLGGVYLLLGRYPEAIAAFERANQIQPTAGVYSNLGVAYFYLRRFELAVQAFEKAVELGRADYRVTGNLARAYFWAGQRERSGEAYRHAIELGQEQLRVNPSDADAHILLASYFARLDRRAEALRHLDRALRLRPEEPEFLFLAALTRNQLGERAEALGLLQAAAEGGYSKAEIAAAPELDNLRDDPKFQALISSQGTAQGKPAVGSTER